jgi:hypothetical protein
MTPETDIRRRRVMEAMANGLQIPQPRRPMDERLPSGLPAMQVAIPEAQRQTLGLSQPTESTPKINIPNVDPSMAPPPNEGRTVPTQVPQVRIGYNTQGLSGLDKIAERRKALEEADPESKVTDTGEILPPEKTGRLKGAGILALLGAGGSDPNHPLRGLGQAIGGGIAGAINPRSAAKAQRQFEIRQSDDDYARGLKIKEGEAQVGAIDALRRQRETEPEIQQRKFEQEREIQNQKLEIERQKAAGLITKEQAEIKQRELDRQSRENIAAANRSSREKIASMGGARGQETEASREKREREANAAQAEYDQLVADEKNAGENKNKAYDYLTQLKNNPNVPKEDIAQATKAAEDADKLYQSYAGKKVEAQRKIRENTSTPQAQQYSGRTMSSANLERYAKDKGLSVEDARKQVEGMGVKIQ